MGKALYQQHVDYFTARMDEHSRVAKWGVVPSEQEYLFRITRELDGYKEDIIVHLTDAYRYGRAELYSRPKELVKGSFIIMGLPHGFIDDKAIKLAVERRIGLGFIGKFMGALNFEKVWEYLTPDEKKEIERKAKERTQRG